MTDHGAAFVLMMFACGVIAVALAHILIQAIEIAVLEGRIREAEAWLDQARAQIERARAGLGRDIPGLRTPAEGEGEETTP